MKQLVEELFYHIIPVNEGYDYLFSDDIYIPVYETTLLVTKRAILPISLVEEKILQLLDLGIYQIDELAQILGLNRRLLEVTLADLYSKDLITVSSNSCRIEAAGRKALSDLNRIEKKQDILKNVCIDGVLGNIVDSSEYELLKSVRNDDNKLKPIIQIGETKNYVNHFKEISQIFDEENKLYFSEGIQPIKEELLRIDKVDNTFVKFIKVPIHVYVSSNGIDIDIVAKLPRQKDLFATYKDYIIEQINNKKVLKNYFKFRKISTQGYDGEVYLEKEGLADEIKKIHFSRNKRNINFLLVENQVLCNRKLLNGEYKDILKYISDGQTYIELYVESLDEWAYNSVFTGTLTENLGKARLTIFYKSAFDKEKSINQINRNFQGVEQCVQKDHNYYICWKSGEYMLYGIPTIRNVINENTSCLLVTYYLKRNKL
ncbi:MAG: hypothetical protein HFG39_15830 [Lachnospiraceae bacterium]|nr:hypothetical protein [Lachnospiraceae bacterium]